MDLQPATNTPLLGVFDKNYNWTVEIYQICLYMSLPFVMMLSSVGMLLIKTGESRETIVVLLSGLVLEGLAFVVYPVSMRAYSLKTITVCWAGASTITSVCGGYLFFNEIPTPVSLFGCILILTGIVITCIG